MAGYDFRGWATRNDRRCSDGRVIKQNAFAMCDGKKVPLVWNHNHDNVNAVLGYGILHNAKDGVIVDGYFNDTDEGNKARELIKHGDIETLSIHATNLKQKGADVVHGVIREVSLVLAGANPGALVIDHSATSEENGFYSEEKAVIYSGEILHSIDDDDYDEDLDEEVDDEEYDDDEYEEYDDDELDDEEYEDDEYDNEEYEDDEEYEEDEEFDDEEYEEDDEMAHGFDELIHSYDETTQDILNTMDEAQLSVAFGLAALASADAEGELSHALSDVDVDGEEIEDVLATMDDDQLAVTYALVGEATGEVDDDDDYDDEEEYEEDDEMEHNVFDRQSRDARFVITTEDQNAILQHAMDSNCGSFKRAWEEFVNDRAMEIGEDADELMHGFSDDDMEYLFPDFKDPAGDGEPWTLTRDMSWVDKVIDGTHKTPFSRIKTRYIDATGTGIRARGYKKGDQKEEIDNVDVLHRETTPQTIYVRDSIDRDDLVDFTEFGIVAYQNKIMTMALKEESAIAILFGDGRDKNDANKIKEDHIRPIWTDDEVYTIHQDIDLDATTTELQGSDTGKHFGENYIWAESLVNASLYSREKYKGSGNLTFFCTPHTRNVMLLARDANGRRIYSTVTELAAALDVKEIVTVEQMEGLTRTVTDGDNTKTKKLLGIFVNMADYNVGATKGGEITSFEQFDIDFNKNKYLKEARFSGALTRIKSAIAIEQDITESSEPEVEEPVG